VAEVYDLTEEDRRILAEFDLEQGLSKSVPDAVNRAVDKGANIDDINTVLGRTGRSMPVQEPDFIRRDVPYGEEFNTDLSGPPMVTELGSVPEETFPLGHDLFDGTPVNADTAWDIYDLDAEEARDINEDDYATKPVSEKEGWYEDPIDFGLALMDGLMFGWSDELMSSMHAGIQSLSGDSYDDTYKRSMDVLQARRDEYAKDHFGWSMTGNILGGMVSPGNLGAIKAAKTLRDASRTKQALGAGGVFAAEGAVAGAGAAHRGERGEGAATGAASNLALGGLLKGAGSAFRGITFKPSGAAEVVDEAGNIIPLNIGAPKGSLLQQFYQKLVGASFPGRNQLIDQTSKYIERFRRGAPHLDEALSKAQQELETNLKAIDDLAKKRIKARTDKEASSIAELERMAKNQLAATVRGINQTFRESVVLRAMPYHMDDETRDLIASTDNIQMQVRYIDNWFRDSGFKSPFGRRFNVNKMPGNLSDRILENTEEVRRISSEADDLVQRNLDLLDKHLGEGTTSGEELVALRNEWSRTANGISSLDPNGAIKKSAVRDMVHTLDEMIMDGLSDADKKKFLEDKAAYRNFAIMLDAVKRASTKAGQRGEFTPDDWLQALSGGSRGGKKFARGEAALQHQADSVAERTEQATDFVRQEFDTMLTRTKTQARHAIEKLKSDLEKAKAEAPKDTIDAAQQEIDDLNTIIKELEELAPGHDSWFLQYAATVALSSILGFLTFGVGGAAASVGLGAGLSAALATPGMQRAIAGQLGMQKTAQKIYEKNAQAIANARRATSRGAVITSGAEEEY
jgi:hypothetical protein